MDKYLISLKNSDLFDYISLDNIESLLDSLNYNLESYNSNDIIAIEGNDCSSLGIILEGNIEIHKVFPSGKVVTINNFKSGDVFGEAILFSNENKYPTNVISSSESIVMYINKKELIKLMASNNDILNNFLSILSNRILMLRDRISNLSLDTLRKKISNIILLEYKKQKRLLIILPFSRKQMAEILNIPRPSLSRELSNMKADKIINFKKNKIHILNLDLLEAILLE